MTHPDGTSPYDANGQTAGRRPQRQTWIWGMTGALAVVVLGAAGAVVAVDAQSNNSAAVRAVAAEYVEAVAAGDANGAERLSSDTESPRPNAAPDPAAFASAEHISDSELGRIRVDFEAGRASGQVSYELGGSSYSDQLELRRTADDEWRVTSGLKYEVAIDASGGGALGLRGADDPLPSDAPSITVYAGEYALISHNPFFETTDDARVAVTSNADSLFASEWIVPGADYAAEVRRQVGIAYEECAEQTDVWELQSCGIAAAEPGAKFSSSPAVDVSVEMTEAPTVSARDELSTWMEIEDRGSFRATYTGRDASGDEITEKIDLQASSADVEVTPTADGLDVAIYPY